MTLFAAYVDEQAGMYRLTFPDAPGCTAAGATPREVIENGTVALREWMNGRLHDGLPLPEPRSFEIAAVDEDRGARMIVQIRLANG